MLRLHQVKLTLDGAAAGEPDPRALAAARLKIPAADILRAHISRRSVDARDKRDVCLMLSLDVRLRSAQAEQALIRRFRPNQAALMDTPAEYDLWTFPVAPYPAGKPRPVVVGAGPAGLFCALGLAVRGAKPLLLERGKRVDERAKDVAALMHDGVLNPESNVLFGEGGAGAFSDGKLTCGLSDPLIRTLMHTFVACGAPEEILIDAKPHIGTDLLRDVLKCLRGKLISLGAEILFERRATGLTIENGKVAAVEAGGERFETDAVYLATGHSARDVYAWLDALGIPLMSKPFAVGVRIEHPQALIDRAQYGGFAGHPALPPADYKLNAKTPDGRGVYTFCMCPGGVVMNASSEEGLLNLNGMSRHARDGQNANSALLVGVRPDDFGDPLSGIALQRRIEKAAFTLGGYRAPCQRVEDFLSGKPSKHFGAVKPSYLPGAEPGELSGILPAFVTENLLYALPLLGKSLQGFDLPDALLSAPETRSSSPVRIVRDERRESPVRGLYPLGEGAGYAGGIISSALDGLKAAIDERIQTMIKAVLFDMDGVLFDTEHMYYDRLIGLMREYGYEMTRAFFVSTLGVPTGACRELYYRSYGNDFPYEAIYERLFGDVRKYVKIHGTPLKPGVAECFAALKARGIKMVLATSAPRFAAEDFFTMLPELDEMLSGKVCGDEVVNGKPDPEIFRKAARLAGFDPADCLGVEDSPSGLKAIHASGAYAVMIPDLLPFTDELKPYANRVLQTLFELPPLIDSLNGQ